MVSDHPGRPPGLRDRATFTLQAVEALENAASVLSERIPGRPPDTELASAWALIGQGWATLAALPDNSHDPAQRT